MAQLSGSALLHLYRVVKGDMGRIPSHDSTSCEPCRGIIMFISSLLPIIEAEEFPIRHITLKRCAFCGQFFGKGHKCHVKKE